MLPYYLLITGLVCQQWSLSVIRAQFIPNLAEMKGKLWVHFIFALPLPQVITISLSLSFKVYHCLKLFNYISNGRMGVVLKRTKIFCWSWFFTAWHWATHHCYPHHCCFLWLVLVWCLPFWALSLPFLLHFFLTSGFLQSLPLMFSFSFLSILFISFLVLLFFRTWLIAPCFLVCHTFQQPLPETSYWWHSLWLPLEVMQTVLQHC